MAEYFTASQLEQLREAFPLGVSVKGDGLFHRKIIFCCGDRGWFFAGYLLRDGEVAP